MQCTGVQAHKPDLDKLGVCWKEETETMPLKAVGTAEAIQF